MEFKSLTKYIISTAFFMVIGFCHNSALASDSPENRKGIGGFYHEVDLATCKQVQVGVNEVRRVDAFTLIVDPSASMTEPYEASERCDNCHKTFASENMIASHFEEYGNGGSTYSYYENMWDKCVDCHSDYTHDKFTFERKLVSCFNQKIPNIKLTASIISFGAPVYTRSDYGPVLYSKEDVKDTLMHMRIAEGPSPLAFALEKTKKAWSDVEWMADAESDGYTVVSRGQSKEKAESYTEQEQDGVYPKMALIIFSDGEDMDEREVHAAKTLNKRYQHRLCIHTVQIGNSRAGAKLLKSISRINGCGSYRNADTLLDLGQMSAFVKEVFLKEDADEDKDGVVNKFDKCPGTEYGLEVDKNGCWKLVMLGDVLFDFNSDVLKQEGREALDEVIRHMKKHGFLRLRIDGHTDSQGSMAYNRALSKNRAKAGKKYLVDNGIASNRIDLKWFSYTVPVASNKTEEGRSLNRRIEFTFSKQ